MRLMKITETWPEAGACGCPAQALYDLKAAAALLSASQHKEIKPEAVDATAPGKNLKVYQKDQLYAVDYRERENEKVYYTGFYRVAIANASPTQQRGGRARAWRARETRP